VKQSYSTAYSTLCSRFQGNRRTVLTRYLTARYSWSLAQANRAIDEYAMFLYVASLHLGVHLIPTQEIDCVWEADILQSTAQYMHTCHALCGSMIHHADVAEMEKESTFAGVESAFAQTRSLFEQHFGKQALSYNALPAACGML